MTKNRKSTNDRALKIIDLIKTSIEERGYPPTCREIMHSLNVKSTATVDYYLNKLESQGLIKRSNKKNRAIELSKDLFPATPSNIITTNDYNNENLTKIPLIGQVAAGTPILAVENFEDVYEFSENLFSKSGDLFMLTVKGESMIDAGIFNKDKIVVKKQCDAHNGEIVVAMINGSATVKRFYRENGRIRLQPENQTMKPIYCVDVDILGVVVGLIRNY